MSDPTLLVRAHDPITSIQAAELAALFSGAHCDRILRALKACGPATAAQLSIYTGLTVVQLDRRLPEILRNGKARVQERDGVPVVRGGYRVWEAV